MRQGICQPLPVCTGLCMLSVLTPGRSGVPLAGPGSPAVGRWLGTVAVAGTGTSSPRSTRGRLETQPQTCWMGTRISTGFPVTQAVVSGSRRSELPHCRSFPLPKDRT